MEINWASVLTTVMSQVVSLPHCQGTKVMPPGRFPASLVRLVGFLEAGMPAEASDRAMVLMALCLLLGACLQIKPYCPRVSNKAPHWHV